MVLNAEDLTIHAVNPGYKELLMPDREVTGLPITEIFRGRDLDDFVGLLKTAVREGQTINSGPMLATIGADEHRIENKLVHTIVPINDIGGSSVTRLFIYSERVE